MSVICLTVLELRSIHPDWPCGEKACCFWETSRPVDLQVATDMSAICSADIHPCEQVTSKSPADMAPRIRSQERGGDMSTPRYHDLSCRQSHKQTWRVHFTPFYPKLRNIKEYKGKDTDSVIFPSSSLCTNIPRPFVSGCPGAMLGKVWTVRSMLRRGRSPASALTTRVMRSREIPRLLPYALE